ncbi:hypothetical protein PK35_11920 [Tamlana nanhaiensis]|uniref:WG repeat-containing protein n=1 Tax=Neotamlana nanhaiensis TaxID=1382798 RepID=A0A0D7W0T1_9FLAO|nr:WG repeat-containing protein [Tamlana nanhaiensis]KJD32136.1 hypothetical protein PK35_11035 [Tamlana nanhaiensis]KJD32298.1 hypothetical protein PK35_11920 [Tamlana nanhaiensis]
MKKLFFVVAFFSLSLCFAQELALARVDGKFGYINKSGDWVIKPQFLNAKSFSGDYAQAMANDKLWGYINRSGEWVIKPTLKKTKAFQCGIAIVNDGLSWYYIDETGNKILSDVVTDKVYDFSEDLAVVRTVDNVGFINKKGETVIPKDYTKAFDFYNGYSRVQKNEKWGLIDKTGNEYIKIEYEEIGNLYNGIIVAKKGGVWGLIKDKTFTHVEGAIKIWDFTLNGDITYAKKGEKVGFINANGEWVIEPKYERVRGFTKGLAPYYENKLWGYINLKGEEVIKAQYKDAEVFSEDGLAPVKTKKEWGFINTDGKLVIEEKYGITAGNFGMFFGVKTEKGFIDGLVRVKYKKEWAFLNTKGEVLNNTWYQNLELFE